MVIDGGWLPPRRPSRFDDEPPEPPPPAPPDPERRDVVIYCPPRCRRCLEAGKPSRDVDYIGRDRNGRTRYHRCRACGAKFISREYLPGQLDVIDDDVDE